MRISTTVSDTTFHATLTDRMTFGDHQTFRAMIQEITNSGATACVLDVGELVAIDSAGLGMFIIAIDAGKKAGWTLTVKGAKGQVKQLLLLAKFDKLLTIQS